jgi:hypothetical protein
MTTLEEESLLDSVTVLGPLVGAARLSSSNRSRCSALILPLITGKTKHNKIIFLTA